MINVETIQELGNGRFVIPAWEVFFYVAVITIYALMDKPRSCLINTYAFTLYWGFRAILPGSFAGGAASETSLAVYIVCGIGIYALITLAALKMNKVRKRRRALSC